MQQTFSKHLQMCLSIVFYFSLLSYVYCMQSAIKHVKKGFLGIYLHIIHICKTIAYLCKYYILYVLMHIIIFRKIFAQRTCHTAPCLLCQRRYCVAVCAMLPDVEIHEISLHEGDKCTCNSDLDCHTLKHTMMSCRNGW